MYAVLLVSWVLFERDVLCLAVHSLAFYSWALLSKLAFAWL